jgi:hypothetical protein
VQENQGAMFLVVPPKNGLAQIFHLTTISLKYTLPKVMQKNYHFNVLKEVLESLFSINTL